MCTKHSPNQPTNPPLDRSLTHPPSLILSRVVSCSHYVTNLYLSCISLVRSHFKKPPLYFASPSHYSTTTLRGIICASSFIPFPFRFPASHSPAAGATLRAINNYHLSCFLPSPFPTSLRTFQCHPPSRELATLYANFTPNTRCASGTKCLSSDVVAGPSWWASSCSRNPTNADHPPTHTPPHHNVWGNTEQTAAHFTQSSPSSTCSLSLARSLSIPRALVSGVLCCVVLPPPPTTGQVR